MPTKSYKIQLDLRLGKSVVDAHRFNTVTEMVRQVMVLLFSLLVDYIAAYVCDRSQQQKDG